MIISLLVGFLPVICIDAKLSTFIQIRDVLEHRIHGLEDEASDRTELALGNRVIRAIVLHVLMING